MDRWTEYCKDLYNYPIKTDRAKVETDNSRQDDEQLLQILKSEVIHAIKSLKNGKSPGIDNVPSELLKGGGEALNDIITKLCQKVWSTNQWPDFIVKLSNYPYSKERRSKKMLKLSYYNYYQPYKQNSPENYLEQINSTSRKYSSGRTSRFRKNRSTTEQILSCRLIMEKHINQQRQVYHNVIDYKKSFDRVWK